MFYASDVRQLTDSLRQQIVHHLKNMVDINSNSANTDGLTRMAQAIETVASDHEILFTRVPVAGKKTGPFHLLYDGVGKSAEYFYGFIGHFDTVHLPESDFSKATVQGERIYGPGVLDMKGGIVTALYSVIIAQQLMNKPIPVKIIFNCDEEIGSPDSKILIEKSFTGAAGVFVFEPAKGDHRGLVVARKGILMGRMEVTGIPAHAGENPEAGADAILEAARKIEALHRLNDSSTGTVVTVGKIIGGNASNQIPDHCTCEIDVRVQSSLEEEKVKRKIEAIMKTSTVRGTRTQYTLGCARPPFEADDNSQLLLQRYKKAADAFHLQTETFQTGGGSDANFTAAQGIPTLDGLGPSGHGPHTNEEYINEKSLWDAICVFTLFLGDLITNKKGELT